MGRVLSVTKELATQSKGQLSVPRGQVVKIGIKKESGEIVKQAWQKEPTYTLWGAINAYTRASQDQGISAETAYRL